MNSSVRKSLQLIIRVLLENETLIAIQNITENQNATLEETMQAIELLQTYLNRIDYDDAEADINTFRTLVNASSILTENLVRFSNNVTNESISILVDVLSNLIGFNGKFFNDGLALYVGQSVGVSLSKLISGIETLGRILLTILKGNVTELVFTTEHIVVIARRIPYANDTGELTIPQSDSIGTFESVAIPQEIVRELSSGGEFKYSLALISVVPNTSNPTRTFSLGSKLLSLTVSNDLERKNLASPILLRFLTPDNNNQEAKCVFLDLQNSIFVSEGLDLNSSEGNPTVCESNHLTSFGVLIRERDQEIGRREEQALSFISYILLSSSLIALILSILIFIVIHKEFFQIEMNRIYFNYALSLALAILTFIFGIQLTSIHPIACSLSVFLLHYFWLAVFSWSLCVSIEIIYLLWITSLNRKNLFWFLLPLGWGLPVPIVVISIGVRHDSYRHSTAAFCFLSYSNGLIWSFIGPILVLLCLNLIALIMACIKIVVIAKNGDKRRNVSNWEVAKQSVINSSFLFPVLGAPWILLPISLLVNSFASTTVFEWIFIILNSPSGILFFVLFTLRHDIVRERLFRRKTETSNQHSNELNSVPKYNTPRVIRPRKNVISSQTCESYVSGMYPSENLPPNNMQTTENNSNTIFKKLSLKCLNSDAISDGINGTVIENCQAIQDGLERNSF